MPLRFALTLVVLALVMCAPSAAAQAPLAPTSLAVEAAPPPAPIVPLVNHQNATLTLRYSWEAGGAAHPEEPVEIVLTAEHPGSLTVTLTPAVLQVAPSPGPTASVTLEALATVGAHANATADEPIPVTIRAVANASGTLQPASAEATFNVKVAAFTILEARIENPILIVEGEETATFTGTLLNAGNAHVQVQITASAPEGVEVTVPEPIPLAPHMSPEGNIKPYTITARVVGSERGPHSIALTFTATPADGPAGGDTAHLNLIVTRKAALPEPSTPALLAVAALATALAAVVARRRAP